MQKAVRGMAPYAWGVQRGNRTTEKQSASIALTDHMCNHPDEDCPKNAICKIWIQGMSTMQGHKP